MPVRRLTVLPATVLALLLTSGAAHAELKAGDRAAELTRVLDRAGKKVTLKKWSDRVVVMTFGASWCAPCKRELPAYEKLAAAYAGKSKKVVFVAVNIDSEAAKAKKFVEQAGLKFVVAAFDAAKTSVDAYDPSKMPTTFVLRGGLVRHVHGGFADGDEKKLASVIDGELAKLK